MILRLYVGKGVVDIQGDGHDPKKWRTGKPIRGVSATTGRIVYIALDHIVLIECFSDAEYKKMQDDEAARIEAVQKANPNPGPAPRIVVPQFRKPN